MKRCLRSVIWLEACAHWEKAWLVFFQPLLVLLSVCPCIHSFNPGPSLQCTHFLSLGWRRSGKVAWVYSTLGMESITPFPLRAVLPRASQWWLALVGGSELGLGVNVLHLPSWSARSSRESTAQPVSLEFCSEPEANTHQQASVIWPCLVLCVPYSPTGLVRTVAGLWQDLGFSVSQPIPS